jgi:hypothetical protein
MDRAYVQALGWSLDKIQRRVRLESQSGNLGQAIGVQLAAIRQSWGTQDVCEHLELVKLLTSRVGNEEKENAVKLLCLIAEEWLDQDIDYLTRPIEDCIASAFELTESLDVQQPSHLLSALSMIAHCIKQMPPNEVQDFTLRHLKV